jgi:prepilin-type N-terminal cleavage/methylation domain-containing protein
MTRRDNPPRRPADRSRGFTLVELLVVLLIVLLVSAVALPTVIPAITHRQVSEAARLLQASLVGARDAAIHNNAPRGIRLLPDPAFMLTTDLSGNPIAPTLPRVQSGTNLGQIDPAAMLAANRFVPIESAPDYTEGRLDLYNPANPASPNYPTGHLWWTGNLPPYPVQPVSPPPPYYNYPISVPINAPGSFNPNFISTYTNAYVTPNVQVVVQAPFDPSDPINLRPNPPTSWFWNVRVGDKIQIDNSGTYYTIVGPLTVWPGSATNPGNPELFVNDGPPGGNPLLQRNYANGTSVYVEYLLLVDGFDDSGDGFIDSGWDGVDNNANNLVDELDEWEFEQFVAASQSLGSRNPYNIPYVIRRRPVPSTGAREVDLPSNIVVDLTTWNTTNKERSRLPVNPYTGYVDILLNPSGDVVPTTVYSTPSSFGMAGAFYHFWLAERSDVFAALPFDGKGNPVPLVNNYPFLLPMPLGSNVVNAVTGASAYDALVSATPALPYLKGDRRLVTLFTRTGQIVTTENPEFDVYNVNQPFTTPQQGGQGTP